MRRQLLLLSSSNVHGYEYLEYAKDDINYFLRKSNVKSILFVPYASKDYGLYMDKVRYVLGNWGYRVDGIHEDNPMEALRKAEAIFIGGGNTFRLLKTLYEENLLGLIRERVLFNGVPYIGSSAGTNVATLSINTTNDMPIVYPPSFEALGLVPFNINPHYLDPDENSTHKGETREQRILEYLELPDAAPVLALREGAILLVQRSGAALLGVNNARLFVKGKEPQEIHVGAYLTELLS